MSIPASRLIDELQQSRRISSVEASVLRSLICRTPVSEAVVTDPFDWLTPTGFSNEKLADWLKTMCAKLHVTPTALAKRAGIAASTVNRFINNDHHDFNLSASTIGKLMNAANEILAERGEP